MRFYSIAADVKRTQRKNGFWHFQLRSKTLKMSVYGPFYTPSGTQKGLLPPTGGAARFLDHFGAKNSWLFSSGALWIGSPVHALFFSARRGIGHTAVYGCSEGGISHCTTHIIQARTAMWEAKWGDKNRLNKGTKKERNERHFVSEEMA